MITLQKRVNIYCVDISAINMLVIKSHNSVLMMIMVDYESYYYNKCGNLSDESSLGVDAALKCLPDSRYDRRLNANVFTL